MEKNLSTLAPNYIGVGGTSKIKIQSVQECVTELNIHASVSGIPESKSNSNEQPVGYDEALYGAISRIVTSIYHNPTFDLYFGVENFIVKSGQVWKDFGLVVGSSDETYTQKELTDFVIFPEEQVLRTKNLKGGFKENTVGSVLYNDGLVTSSKDPHFSLCGIHRKDLLKPAITKILKQYLDDGILHVCPETNYQGV